MKKTCLLFLTFFVLCLPAFAQKQKPQAFKFDEFAEVSENERKDRLERFSEMQKSMPKSALYIILYVEKGKARNSVDFLIKQYLDALVKLSRIDPVRISATVGGYRKQQTTEFWIVPERADFPNPTPDEKFKPEKLAEIGDVSDEEFKKLLESLLKQQEANSSDTLYLITYGKTLEEIDARELLIRDSLNWRRYDPLRVVLVQGGESNKIKTVVWLVPEGAEPPTP